MRSFLAAIALALAALFALAPAQDATSTDLDALVERVRQFIEPIPTERPELANNPYSPEKELLGRTLWFDPRLSSSWAISCNTCHHLGMAGVDLQPASLGHGWQRGGRNSPTVFNAVFNVAQFWDGRADDLAQQAMGPIQDALEMNNTPERVIATLQSMPDYIALFEAAFPDQDDPVTFENIAGAIEIFEATLLTPNAPFDRFLQGETDALTEVEVAGLELFINRGCVACHMGVNLGGHGYFPFGVVERPDAAILPPGDVGRFNVTNVEADRYAFKSPTLRNVALTPPYFHSGVVWSLEDAVRIMGTAQLGAQLTDEEVASITAFLHTLNGDQPEVTIPPLPPITERTPEPQPGLRP